MPSKNSRKQYVEDAYYHIYNRGVEKRVIFKDKQDYFVFLSYLKEYLVTKNMRELTDIVVNLNSSPLKKNKALKLIRLNNFADDISLISYCLMPNHFHFLLKQMSVYAMDKFMNSLGTRYTMYFNLKYERVGPLYQGVYKAVLVSTDEQLLHLTRYIHRNPLSIKSNTQENALIKQPSTYLEYIEKRKTAWINTSEVLPYFSKTNPKLSYKSFMDAEEDQKVIENLTIDS